MALPFPTGNWRVVFSRRKGIADFNMCSRSFRKRHRDGHFSVG